MIIEIVTIVSVNYGNRLQNYALQEVLKKYGAIVYTDDFNRTTVEKLKRVIRRIRKKTAYDKFCIFDKKIKWNNIYKMSERNLDKIDRFIVGSDQVWNPIFDFNSDREFLPFVPQKKKYSYAASIGINELPLDYKKSLKKSLESFERVSVREDSAKKIIESIMGFSPEVVLDPTMLLSSKEWGEVEKDATIHINEKYIVKYMIGIRTPEYEDYIDEFAEKQNLLVVDITNNKSFDAIGPAEFVSLIHNSQYVFTDSYHATVFSILFEKRFLSIRRPSEIGFGDMNSRFDTILSCLGLQNRCVSSIDSFHIINDNIDYEKVNMILEKEKKESLDYIKAIVY